MAVLPVSLTLPTNQRSLTYVGLSSFSSVTDGLSFSLSSLSLHRRDSQATNPLTIRMGGGPRTFPGGVSKWQWKRMQKRKAKQLLKARLMRERQIYEMRKRSELKAAVSELERPWEVVEQAAPNLFSVGADEQVKVLADRFQKPGGFDLWTEKDGPQLFETPDGLPTARFFPKGVVHSIKPYGKVDLDEDLGEFEYDGDMGVKSGARLTDGVDLGLGSANSGKQRGRRRSLGGAIGESKDRYGDGLGEFEYEAGDMGRKTGGRLTDGVDLGLGSTNSVKQRGRRRSLEGVIGGSKGRYGDGLRPSNSRVLSGVNAQETGKGREEGNDGRGDGSFRKNGSTGSVGSRNANGAMKKTDLRKPVSGAGERRSNSKLPQYGDRRSRQDGRLEKRGNSYDMEDVFDMSLQRDGSYGLDSR